MIPIPFAVQSILVAVLLAFSLESQSAPLMTEVQGQMKKNVEFWVQIYGKYESSQGLIHDAKYVDHVYEVLDFKGVTTRRFKLAQEKKKKWKQVLLSVHQKQDHPEQMSADEKKVFSLFQDIDEPHKFLNAAHRKRLRFQLGQKDRFLEGLQKSGRYLARMEEVFAKEGMPVELARLPFVESSFNLDARSKVGASGIWQFMRSTGNLFLKINDCVDERNDPLLATEAAAQLLKLNYGSLKSWPLAVTAYNHGRKNLMRAVRRVGSSDLNDLVKESRTRSFGFASTNFFAEFLAAVEVEKNAERYFGKVDREKPIDFIEILVPSSTPYKKLVSRFDFKTKDLQEVNPALMDVVFSNKQAIPAGYRFRIPRAPQSAN